MIHALTLAGVVGAALPLILPRGRLLRIQVAHLAMTLAMAAMWLPGASAGWATAGMACLLIALAMWVTADVVDRSAAVSCAVDLTAMAIILLFVSPHTPDTGGALPPHLHQESLHGHGLSSGATTSTWLGLLVLACWAAIALYPHIARRGATDRRTTIATASAALMLTGMAPMAA
ncbi:DUF5134 domain-containing protein [Rhodococcus pseudokoreensis]|uniref:DUF5134 domain-containing protein n=1 Tax=Rhodococcus pseudokoreensis TaxID=2811421 RepID=A0A974W4R8_9NOCA|nr:DUF5134 domain-containing protein [Rhodococcus pseudokoreensis]QSE90632.1 DUF5134 domain-containing protein [Rhodococcus pseudokoreensis]